MSGVSEMPFRVLVREMGAAAAPTELVSAKGLSYGQKGSEDYLRHDVSERPFWVQLFGGEPEIMADGAVRAAELGAEIIDVNMGCPVPKVIKTGAGVALMRDSGRAARVVEAIARRTGLPVTAKIRSGWDAHNINAVEFAQTLADAGCVAVAVHARTRSQGYSGTADWSVIADVVRAVSIPVIGNGDVRTAEDGRRMIGETGCAAVMVGRGAMGNPWLFAELSAADGDWKPPTRVERWAVIERHLRAIARVVDYELKAVRKFRQHMMWYARGITGAAAFRKRVIRVESLEELCAAGRAFFVNAENESPFG